MVTATAGDFVGLWRGRPWLACRESELTPCRRMRQHLRSRFSEIICALIRAVLDVIVSAIVTPC